MAVSLLLLALIAGFGGSLALDSLTYNPTWIQNPDSVFEYTILPQKMDFDTGKTSCMSYTANYASNLASINSKAELNFVLENVIPALSNETRYWIGARSIATFPKKKPLAESWAWVDQTEPFRTVMNQFYQPSFESCKKNPNREGCCTFENGQCLFVSGQPNRRDTKGKSCMFLSTQESKVGFNDARCTRKNFPICKRQAEGAVTEPAPTLNDTVTASSTTPATTVPPTTAVDDSNWFSLNPVFLSSTTVSAPGSIANFGRSIFVADNDEYKILKFQLMEDGTLSFVRKWGGVGNTNGLFSSVGELAVSPDGERLYAVDTNNQRVQVFDTTGKFLFTFGSFGEGEGQFMSPRGLAISKKANAAGYVVTVTDAALNSIQQFDAEGNFLLRWTDNLNTPSSASFSGDGTLYVADARNNRVTAYHRLNNKVRLLAYGTLGSNNGQFNYPSSLAVATNGMTVVADTFNNRVQIFSPRGQFVSTFGVGGANNGDLLNPLSVAISNSFIIVANTMNNRVDVFGEVTTVSP